MVLRRVNKEQVEHFIDLGDEFQLIEKRNSPVHFEESAKGHFGKEEIPDKVFAILSPKYDNDVPVYSDDINSIMSTDGKFFKQLAVNM